MMKLYLLPLPHIILWEAVRHQRAAQRRTLQQLLGGDGHGDGCSPRFPDADAAVHFVGRVVSES